MSGKFQFLARGENAQPGQSAVLGRFLDENSFREIHLARDCLHRVVRESVAVGEDCQRISFKPRGGEDIQSIEAVAHGVCRKLDYSFSRSASVLSLITFPVFKVDFGSNSRTCVSSSETGRCSTPRGTMINSPGPTSSSWSRNFIRKLPATTMNISS